MKKFISLTIAVLMIMSMLPTALAVVGCPFCGSTSDYGATYCFGCDLAGVICEDCDKCNVCDANLLPKTNPHTQGTKVEYTASGSEAYTVTVPAMLSPTVTQGSGNVVAQGTWASNRRLVVTADESVVLTNSINPLDTKTLVVYFECITLKGSNTSSVSDTHRVLINNLDPTKALFGTWSGKFYYQVEMVDVELITFSIEGTEYQAENAMTWNQWVESDYNTAGYRHENASIRIDTYRVISGVYGTEMIQEGKNYSHIPPLPEDEF